MEVWERRIGNDGVRTLGSRNAADAQHTQSAGRDAARSNRGTEGTANWIPWTPPRSLPVASRRGCGRLH